MLPPPRSGSGASLKSSDCILATATGADAKKSLSDCFLNIMESTIMANGGNRYKLSHMPTDKLHGERELSTDHT